MSTHQSADPTERVNAAALLSRLDASQQTRMLPMIADAIAALASAGAGDLALSRALVASPDVQQLTGAGVHVVDALSRALDPQISHCLLGAPRLPPNAQRRLDTIIDESFAAGTSWKLADTLTFLSTAHPSCGRNARALGVLVHQRHEVTGDERARMWPALASTSALEDADALELLVQANTTYRSNLAFAGSGAVRAAEARLLRERPHLRASLLRAVLAEHAQRWAARPDLLPYDLLNERLLDATVTAPDVWDGLAAHLGIDDPDAVARRVADDIPSSSWERLLVAAASHPDLPARWMTPAAHALETLAGAGGGELHRALADRVRAAHRLLPMLENGTDTHVREALERLRPAVHNRSCMTGLGAALRNSNASTRTLTEVTSRLLPALWIDVTTLLQGRTRESAANLIWALGVPAGRQLLRADAAGCTARTTDGADSFDVFAQIALTITRGVPSAWRGSIRVTTWQRSHEAPVDEVDNWADWPLMLETHHLRRLPWQAATAAGGARADASLAEQLLQTVYGPGSRELLTAVARTQPVATMPAGEVIDLCAAVLTAEPATAASPALAAPAREVLPC